MPTTLPERCAPSHEKESSFSSLAVMALLLILAAFLSVLADLSPATQHSFTYPMDGQIYFP
jgi:hypothetical protein